MLHHILITSKRGAGGQRSIITSPGFQHPGPLSRFCFNDSEKSPRCQAVSAAGASPSPFHLRPAFVYSLAKLSFSAPGAYETWCSGLGFKGLSLQFARFEAEHKGWGFQDRDRNKMCLKPQEDLPGLERFRWPGELSESQPEPQCDVELPSPCRFSATCIPAFKRKALLHTPTRKCRHSRSGTARSLPAGISTHCKAVQRTVTDTR